MNTTGGTFTGGAVWLVAALTLAPHAGAQSPADGVAADPVVHAAPEAGGPRRFTAVDGLRLRDAPAPDAAPVGAPAGAVARGEPLANLGCEASSGRAWCRVGSLRGEARGYAPGELLVPATGPDGSVPVGVDGSARRARRGDFDAAATIACTQVRGQAPGTCSARAARGGGGDATVRVSFPNGFARTLRFVHGRFVRADATMSGVGTDIDWRVEGGTHRVRVEDQRYEIPVELVVGPAAEIERADR